MNRPPALPLLLAALALFAFRAPAPAQDPDAAPEAPALSAPSPEQPDQPPTQEQPMVILKTTLGDITIKLFPDKAPVTVANFLAYVDSGHYNGTIFHRVIDGFMIQAGDPLTKDANNKPRFGTGGPDYTIPAEFVPAHNHKKGALAAARRGDAVNPYKESSGSQFYIVQDERNCAQLDGEYTVFGETIEGLDVIDKIASVETDRRDCPLQDVKIVTIKLAE